MNLDFKTLISLATALLPYLEKLGGLLPVSERVRSDLLPLSCLACLACVVAGLVTAQRTSRGLVLGWLGLALFLLTVLGLCFLSPAIASFERPLYVMTFSFFGLTVASFLGTK